MGTAERLKVRLTSRSGRQRRAPDPGMETALWENVRNSSDPAEIEAFLRLFPASRYAEEAKRRAAGAERRGRDSKDEDRAVGLNRRNEPAASAECAQHRSAGFRSRPRSRRSAPAPVVTAANVPPVEALPTQPRGGNLDPNRFQDCPTCPWMIRIPAGGFMMGQGAREPELMPAHHVDIRTFALGQAPVTVAEWKACMAAKACSFLPRMRVAEDRTPVHNLSWEDVGQYMAWLSKTTGHPYRLPSEAEWEYAARGGTTTRYWWGDSVGMFLANCTDCGGAQDMYGPLPVDTLQPNPFGLYDMLGGVSEWTADCWFPNYRGAPADATPRQAKICDKRVLRGGSFRAAHDEITVTYRGNYDAPVRYLVNGFRVARDLE